jgi:hypothetical protein
MRAISKMDHDKLFKFIHDIRKTYSIPDKTLVELEKDLEAVFNAYQQQLNDLKVLIIEYDTKKKRMSQKIKQLIRNEISAVV